MRHIGQRQQQRFSCIRAHVKTGRTSGDLHIRFEIAPRACRSIDPMNDELDGCRQQSFKFPQAPGTSQRCFSFHPARSKKLFCHTSCGEPRSHFVTKFNLAIISLSQVNLAGVGHNFDFFGGRLI